jgi:hypothetical protein
MHACAHQTVIRRSANLHNHTRAQLHTSPAPILHLHACTPAHLLTCTLAHLICRMYPTPSPTLRCRTHRRLLTHLFSSYVLTLYLRVRPGCFVSDMLSSPRAVSRAPYVPPPCFTRRQLIRHCIPSQCVGFTFNFHLPMFHLYISPPCFTSNFHLPMFHLKIPPPCFTCMVRLYVSPLCSSIAKTAAPSTKTQVATTG